MKGKIFIFVILIFALVCASIGSVLYLDDAKNDELRDIFNFTESTLTYDGNYSFAELRENANISADPLPEIKYFRLVRVVDSFANFVLTAGFEATKFFVEFGYENPDIDYKLIGKVLLVVLILSFWAALIPILVIIVLIYKGIIWSIKKFKNIESQGRKCK